MMTEPKRIGRPPSTDPFQTISVQFRASDLARIAAVRGSDGLSTWIRETCLAALNEPTPAQLAPVKRATVAKIEASFGPRRAAPGARLKNR